MAFLARRVGSVGSQVRMWAAYQLVDRHQADCDAYIDRLWEADAEEIRESAITLIGKYDIERYAFPLLRVFNDRTDPLQPVAGVALGRMRYQPVERQLERWFDGVAANPDATAQELEAAAEGLLEFNADANWERVWRALRAGTQNHAYFSTLFGQLCLHASTPQHVQRLTEVYGEVRSVFNDVHLTQDLVEMVGRSGLNRLFQSRLGGGYPLSAVYQECRKVMGEEPAGNTQVLEDLAACRNSRWGVERFAEGVGELIQVLAVDEEHAALARAFVAASRSWLPQWEDAILKVREEEYHLIVSAPLAALLQQVEAQCLANPEQEALRITRIYQSPLLSPHFMTRVLKLLKAGESTAAGTGLTQAAYTGWVRDEEKDALWKLSTGQLDDVDYPLEQVLPQPWAYGIPGVMERLVSVLEQRLPAYLSRERVPAVDYALEVLRRAGTREQVPLLLDRFDTLINHHHHSFVELMTHLPYCEFLEPLVEHHREGETDLLRLIHFICDVHELPYPALETGGAAHVQHRNPTGSLRLRCRECGGSYQYAVDVLYLDEERIEQRQIPMAQDLWSPQVFQCKKCRAAVPFDPENRYLQDLFAELLASRLFPPSEQEGSSVAHVQLIQFPTFRGKRLNPAHFLAEMKHLTSEGGPGAEQAELLELGRFQMEIGAAEEAKGTLLRSVAGPSPCPLALYYLGVIAFQQKNLYEARVYFSRLMQSCAREDFDNELDNPVDMAHHYLNLLDKREFKRSHFRLVSS